MNLFCTPKYKTKLFYSYELHVKSFHYNADPLGFMLLGWGTASIGECEILEVRLQVIGLMNWFLYSSYRLHPNVLSEVSYNTSEGIFVLY
jgi:hypothetical protein